MFKISKDNGPISQDKALKWYQRDGTLKDRIFTKGFIKEKIILFLILYAVAALSAFSLFGFLTNFMNMGFDSFTLSFKEHVAAGATSKNGWGASVVFYIGFVGLWNLLRFKNTELNAIKNKDSRGVNYSENGTYGTAEWLSRDEARKVFETGNIDDLNGVILGQYSTEGKETVAYPIKDGKNNNILIIGKPGSGKSFCYVRNAIFQAIKRGESQIITDPKGELYESTAKILEEHGYKVKVFNLINPERSDSWNCMNEIYDPATGNISDMRVTEFVDILIKNTSNGKDEQFWVSGYSNLLKAFILKSAYLREGELIEAYKRVAMNLFKKDADVSSLMTDKQKRDIFEMLDANTEHCSMKAKENAIRMLLHFKYNDPEDVDKEMRRIANSVSAKCNLSQLYYDITTCDIATMAESFEKNDYVKFSPALTPWNIFKNSPTTTQPNILQGLGQRLQLLQNKPLRRILINDDICLEDISKDKVALFCIISDKTTTMAPITSMLFTFLFKDISDVADKEGPENRRAVNIIADEFANLGVIPQFDVIISTVRSRKINISIILQNITQLTNRYGTAGETIISCCDTIIFLGANDETTTNFISELSGIATIRSVSTKDSRNTAMGDRAFMQGYSIGEGDGKRYLMNPDEVRRLPENQLLVYRAGINLVTLYRCGFIHHPFYRNKTVEIMKLANYPLAREKYAAGEKLDAFLTTTN